MTDNQIKTKFVKVSIKESVKREIDIIASSEQRPVYDVVADMLEIYKGVTLKARKNFKSKPVTVAEYIVSH